MHAWYQLSTGPGGTEGLGLVEARDEQHARYLGADLGAAPGQLYVAKLPPDSARPLLRRFAECPHCRFLKESGLDRLSESEKARLGAQGK